MGSKTDVLLATILLSMLSFLFYAFTGDLAKTIGLIGAGVLLSTISYIIHLHRLEFLSAASTHFSLLAITVGYVISYYTSFNMYIIAAIVALGVIYTVLYLVNKGMLSERATALIVGATSFLTVIATYYAVTRLQGLRYDLASLMIGSVLFLRGEDLYFMIPLTITLVVFVAVFFDEIIELSIDEKSFIAIGRNPGVYRYLIYTFLGLATVGLLRIVGYITEHVLILLPSILVSPLARGSRNHLLLTVLVGVTSIVGGYYLSVQLDLPLSGGIGIVLFLLFIVARVCAGMSRR